MATCKECVHYNLCNITQIDYQPKCTIQHIEEYCGQFKDPSRLVYLPCKVGDSIYRIKGGSVRKEMVLRFEISTSGIILVNINGYHIGYADTIGKSIFFTEKEAEQALAKQNQPDNTPQ